MRLRKRMRAGLGGLLVGAVMVLSAQPAMAVQSDIYDSFTKCPTSSPAMNDPSAEFVACSSALVPGGLLKVGNFQAPITSPVQLQFGMTIAGGEIKVVPAGTSLDSAPFLVPNPFYRPPAPPVAAPPAKKKKVKKKAKKKHKAKKKGQKKKAKKNKKKKKKKRKPVTPPVPSVPPAPAFDPFVSVTVEPIGDVEKLSLLAVLEGKGTLFELSSRLHIQGNGMGPNCYIGSPAEPVRLKPVVKAQPASGGIEADPNGFPVEVLTLNSIDLEDAEFSVPPARGCGPVDPATGAGSLDQTINAAIGLPAVSGGSKVIFSQTKLELAASGMDGTPPDGGAALEEAFKAAK